MIRSAQFLAFCFLISVAGLLQADEGFPGRSLYPGVAVIELDELHRRLGGVTVVDVRSEFEFNTLHIVGAQHIPLSERDFADRVAALAQQDESQLVFYCNGRSCEKSYQAAVKAERAGVAGTVSFDAGIFDWARTFPNDTVLLGEPLADAGKLLTRDKFEAHLLPPEKFGLYLDEAGFAVDARDNQQRAGLALFMGREKRIPFDNRARWEQLLAERTDNSAPLLIYDAVGKQVQWLQYFLEAKGVENYYFMAGGAKAFFDML